MENILEENKVTYAVTDLLENQLYKVRPWRDKIWLTGLGLLGFSLLIFLISGYWFKEEGASFGIFCVIYIAAIFYYIMVAVNRKYLDKNGYYRQTFGHTTILLIILLISAYTLNRSITIFQDSTTWLCVYLVISSLPFIFYIFYSQLPKTGKLIYQVLLGSSLVLWFYLSVYLTPIYHIGLAACIALGFSLHCFVPLLLLIYGIRAAMRTCLDSYTKLAFWLGVMLPLLFTSYFFYEWHRINRSITQTVQRLETEDYNQLSAWLRVSQTLDKSWVSEKLIKSNLVYVTFADEMNWGFDRLQFNEVKKHDPLVAAASFFFGKTSLNDEDKIKILKTTYDARHQAEEKLWSGENLQTSSIVTRSRIYPAYRLAYTEKVIRIQNTSTNRWQNEQEALYTFHLPEGAVVTSLSLWINGQEEKGYLTTKSKADSAYTTIVGVEVRDPSVVHWQEGNRVVVRVFPCTSKEERQFKIGVTAPLRQEGQNLIFQNYYFEGPRAKGATEQLYVQFNEAPVALHTNYDLAEEGNNSYRYTGKYNPDWNLVFKAPELASNGFSFSGKHYSLAPVKPEFESFTPEAIYLDVNNIWTEQEWQAILNATKNQNVYVYSDGFIQVNEQNQGSLFNALKKQKFSLFPVHKLTNPAQTLLVTKSADAGPNLQDLKETEFAKDLKTYLQQLPRLRVFSLSAEKSAYLKTLKELRVFTYDSGTPDKLKDLLQKKRFVKDLENEKTVILDEAQLKITASEIASTTSNTAPDHLLRLFAYNNIMKQVSKTYFKTDAANDELIAEAQTANVVSPVSSLVVLETQQDYERFGISQSKNSLGNASAKAAGAVPEPHEWALIILAVILIGWLLLKPNLGTWLVR